MKLRQAANDVMLRINDVALRANGTEHLSHIGATILHPNTKAEGNELEYKISEYFLGKVLTFPLGDAL